MSVIAKKQSWITTGELSRFLVAHRRGGEQGVIGPAGGSRPREVLISSMEDLG